MATRNLGDMAGLPSPPRSVAPDPAPLLDSIPPPPSSPSGDMQEAAPPVVSSSVEPSAAAVEDDASTQHQRTLAHAGATDRKAPQENEGEHQGQAPAVAQLQAQQEDEETESEVEFEAIDEGDASDGEHKTDDGDAAAASRSPFHTDHAFAVELLAPTHWNTQRSDLGAFAAPLEPAKATPRGVSGTGRRRQSTAVSVAEDEALLRALLEREAQFADPSAAKSALWEAVAAACGGRFSSGKGTMARVTWLSEVVRDRTHGEHTRLSSELKKMVRRFKKVRRSGVDREKAKRLSVAASTSASDEVVEAEETVLPTEKQSVKQSGPATLDAVLEEPFVAVVLKHAKELAQSERREKVWEKIVKDAEGRFEMGSQARNRLMWLLKILKTPAHREHGKLTPKLREMLKKFLSFDPFQRVSRPRSNGSVTSKLSLTESQAKGSEKSAKSAIQSDAKAPEKSKTKWLTIQPELDESLVRLVVEKRPFECDRYVKPVVWADIAQALQNPRIKDGLSGQKRCQWLASVFENASHEQNANLTPALRELLDKYVKIYDSFVNNKATNGKNNGDAIQETQVEGKRSSSQPRTKIQKTPSSRRLSREDSALLREVLVVRPFHKNEGEKELLWHNVACNLASMSSLGSTEEFRTGESCSTRTEELLRMLHDPVEASFVQLSENESEMLRLLDALHKTRWVHHKRLQTDKHRQLTAKIEEYLVRTQPVSQSKHRLNTASSEFVKRIDGYLEQEQRKTQPKKAAVDVASHKPKTPPPAPVPERSKPRSSRSLNDTELKRRAVDVIAERMSGKELSLSEYLKLSKRAEEIAKHIAKSSSRQRKQHPATKTPRVEPQGPAQQLEPTAQDEQRAEEVQELVLEDRLDIEKHQPVDENENSPRARKSSRKRRRNEREVEEETKGKDSDDGVEVEKRSQKYRRKQRESDHLRGHRTVPSTSLVLDENQVHALQAEIVRLRSLCALSEADRKSFSARIRLLNDEVESCRELLMSQTASMELERREHRQELRAMVAMMQTERETHQRETNAMLEGIRREREDRKNEFVAMMNLVTRAAQPSVSR